jgi:hypothetical protein
MLDTRAAASRQALRAKRNKRITGGKMGSWALRPEE